MLPADSGDVDTCDLQHAVEKENRKVLTVGESDQGVKRSSGEIPIGDGRFGKAQGAARLDKSHLVHWNRLKLGFGAVGRIHRKPAWWRSSPGSSGSFAPGGRRDAPRHDGLHSPRGPSGDTAKAEARHRGAVEDAEARRSRAARENESGDTSARGDPHAGCDEETQGPYTMAGPDQGEEPEFVASPWTVAFVMES